MFLKACVGAFILSSSAIAAPDLAIHCVGEGPARLDLDVTSWNHSASDQGVTIEARAEINGSIQFLVSSLPMPIPAAGASFQLKKSVGLVEEDGKSVDFHYDAATQTAQYHLVQYRGYGPVRKDFTIDAALSCR